MIISFVHESIRNPFDQMLLPAPDPLLVSLSADVHESIRNLTDQMLLPAPDPLLVSLPADDTQW